MKKLSYLLLLLTSATVLGYFSCQIWVGCSSAELYFFSTHFERLSRYPEITIVVLFYGLMFLLMKRFSVNSLALSIAPGVFLIPFLFFPFDFWTITAVIAITTLSLFRLLLILPAPKFIFFMIKNDTR